jgi:hypothetical protein
MTVDPGFAGPPKVTHRRSTDPDWARRFFLNGATASCWHVNAEPVITVDGEHVGYLCPDCDSALAPDWNPAARAAASLMGAGFSPENAVALAGTAAYWVDGNDVEHNGHAAKDCPARLDVTGIADATPQYVHGDCQPPDSGIPSTRFAST